MDLPPIQDAIEPDEVLPPPPRTEVDPWEFGQLVTRVERIERHIGLAEPGPAQLDFGPTQLAKIVGLVSLDLTDENVEAVRRIIGAANLVSLGAV